MEATVHFGNLMDLFDLKEVQNLLNTSSKIQKRRGVREERTPLKTKEGYRAVFAEQEASASNMAAASCLDPTFKTSWCGWRGKSLNLSIPSSQNDRSPSSPVPPSLPSPDSHRFAKRRLSRDMDRDALTTKLPKYGKDLQKGFDTGDP